MAVDAIRGMLREYTSDERKEILGIIARAGDDAAPALLDDEAIKRAIEAADGHVGRAADVLGCARRTLQKKMREYGIPPGQPGNRRKFVQPAAMSTPSK